MRTDCSGIPIVLTVAEFYWATRHTGGRHLVNTNVMALLCSAWKALQPSLHTFSATTRQRHLGNPSSYTWHGICSSALASFLPKDVTGHQGSIGRNATPTVPDYDFVRYYNISIFCHVRDAPEIP